MGIPAVSRIMMITCALMELTVINIGYDLGVIPQTGFTMLVIMALVSTRDHHPGPQALAGRARDRGARAAAHGLTSGYAAARPSVIAW